MSPEFSDDSNGPEIFDDPVTLKSRGKNLVTPPDTPPQNLDELEVDSDLEEDEIEVRLSREIMENLQKGDADDKILSLTRPRRVAIESFDLDFEYNRKRRHHARENCLKRGVVLYVEANESSREIFEGMRARDFKSDSIRSIQKRDELKRNGHFSFLVILNREDERNKFITAIKKERRKSTWRADKINNTIYQAWVFFNNQLLYRAILKHFHKK